MDAYVQREIYNRFLHGFAVKKRLLDLHVSFPALLLAPLCIQVTGVFSPSWTNEMEWTAIPRNASPNKQRNGLSRPATPSLPQRPFSRTSRPPSSLAKTSLLRGKSPFSSTREHLLSIPLQMPTFHIHRSHVAETGRISLQPPQPRQINRFITQTTLLSKTTEFTSFSPSAPCNAPYIH